MNKKILVIDGMGGGIGKSIVEKLKSDLDNIHIIAAGTNSVALERMITAGANEGSDDEKCIINYINSTDIIIGAMGILIPSGLSGEITQNIVLTICSSSAIKILIPMDKCGIQVATDKMPISHYISCAISQIKTII